MSIDSFLNAKGLCYDVSILEYKRRSCDSDQTVSIPKRPLRNGACVKLSKTFQSTLYGSMLRHVFIAF